MPARLRGAFITGITGQDGGYLAEQLVARGTQVHGLLRPEEEVPGHLQVLTPDLVLHVLDLDDEAALTRAVEVADPDAVINLAGVSSVGLSWSQPVLTSQVNGVFVARLLQLLWERQERTGRQIRFVQASSAEIFAGATSAPQDESTPISPGSPYGASKAFAHELVASSSVADGAERRATRRGRSGLPEVCVDHPADQLLEAGRWFPAQDPSRPRRVADKLHRVGGARELRIRCH